MINIKTLIGVGIVLLIAASFFMWTGCAGKPADTSKPAATTTTDETPAAQEVMYVCPMHPDERSTDPNATCSVCGMKLEPETEEVMMDIMAYACPMHPDERSTDPDATCSICGMPLEPVPVEADKEEGEEESGGHQHM